MTVPPVALEAATSETAPMAAADDQRWPRSAGNDEATAGVWVRGVCLAEGGDLRISGLGRYTVTAG